MVSLAEKIPVDEITAARLAHQARPGRLLLTLVLGVFFVLGWLAGRAWLLAVDCFNSARIGWWRGTGMTPEQVGQRLAARAKQEPAPA
jgi:hypothetical protein